MKTARGPPTDACMEAVACPTVARGSGLEEKETVPFVMAWVDPEDMCEQGEPVTAPTLRGSAHTRCPNASCLQKQEIG